MAEKEAPGGKDAAAAAAAAAGGGGAGAWMPVIAVVVLVPVLSYAMAMFVIAPQMEKRFAAVATNAGAAGGEAAHGAAGKGEGHGKEGEKKGEATFSHEFKDIVSNLAGSMRSRYIKVTFTAYSADANFEKIVEENRAKLLDATIGVLARLSLADLEDAGAKNKVRNEIVYAMEAVLHERVVEEIYFSEFVVQ